MIQNQWSLVVGNILCAPGRRNRSGGENAGSQPGTKPGRKPEKCKPESPGNPRTLDGQYCDSDFTWVLFWRLLRSLGQRPMVCSTFLWKMLSQVCSRHLSEAILGEEACACHACVPLPPPLPLPMRLPPPIFCPCRCHVGVLPMPLPQHVPCPCSCPYPYRAHVQPLPHLTDLQSMRPPPSASPHPSCSPFYCMTRDI